MVRQGDEKMIICRWCGKRIKKTDAKIHLGSRIFYDHEECYQERCKHHKIDPTTHPQKKLGGWK